MSCSESAAIVHSLRVDIAGVRFSVTCGEADILPEANPAYRGFISPEPEQSVAGSSRGQASPQRETSPPFPLSLPGDGEDASPLPREGKGARGLGPIRPPGGSADVEVRLTLEQMPDTSRFQKVFDSGQPWVMFKKASDRWLKLAGAAGEPLWLARWNAGATRATVYCGKRLVQSDSRLVAVANPVRYPLDQMLLVQHLTSRDGLLLHGAGVNLDGKGLVFPGKSGAGKSTICRQLAGRGVPGMLSDDRVVVRKVEGVYRAFGTPWPGDARIAANDCAALCAILFLAHDSRNRIEPLSPRDALERLLPVTSIPWYDRDLVPDLLGSIGRLMSDVPAYELGFRPTVEVVNVLEEFVASL